MSSGIPTSGTSNGGGGPEFSEVFALLSIGPVLIFVAIGIAGGMWKKASDWLLANNIVVPGGEALVTIPGSDGTGLDAARLVIAVGLIIVSILLTARTVQNRRLAGDR